MLGHPALHKQLREPEHHIIRPKPSCHINGHALTGIFIHNRQQLHRTPIFGADGHEIVRPHMVRMLRPEPDTGAIRQPEPSAGRVLLRDLQPFTPPNPLDPLVIDPPSVVSQEPRHLSIAIPSVLAGELDNGLREKGFIIGGLSLIPLCGPCLPQYPAHPAFCKAQRRTAVLHGLPSARWA